MSKKQIFHIEVEAKLIVDENDYKYKVLSQTDKDRLLNIVMLLFPSVSALEVAQHIVKLLFGVQTSAYFCAYLIDANGDKRFGGSGPTQFEAKRMLFHVIPHAYVPLIKKDSRDTVK